MSNLTDHSTLIDQIGGPADLARRLSGIPDVNIRAWKMRNRIPPEHWPDVIEAARDKGFEVSADWLMRTTPPRQGASKLAEPRVAA